ncbi:MAG: hypothetical protein KJ046_01045 [Anaerolineae bacterium]|nr:hypothetical protein [Anaerolineae bacterium]RIK22778.1 MAG: hypothetical protein DCC51_04530 [Anaerolineae bacterium]
MINWMSVVYNSFWIVGLALMLAAFSYYYWLAGQAGRPLRQELSRPPFQGVATIGMLLVGIGLALTAKGIWQVLPAVALIIVCIIALLVLFKSQAK